MIEKYIEITCDGCGDTSCCQDPNISAAQYRIAMKDYGWVNYGALDYCRDCVESGNAKRRVTGFGCKDD